MFADQLRRIVNRARQGFATRPSLRELLLREYSIAEASFILMASFFVSSGLGALRQVLFNAAFGVSMQANAYYAAFRLPDTLFSLVAAGTLSSALVPVLLTTRREGGEGEGWRLSSLVFTALLVFFTPFILLSVLFAPALVKNLLAPGFDAPTAALTATLTRIMLLQPLVLLLASVAAGVLTSRNQFLLIGLSAVSHNACLVISVLLVIAFPGIGVYGPTLGVFAGATLQILILSPGLHGAGGRVGLAWPLADARLRQVVRLLVPNSLSAAVNYSGFIVDTSFASRAPEQAAMAAIYNGFQLVTLPISLIGRAVGMAAFPRMAAQADAMAYRALRNTLLRTLGAAIALALPACGALFLLGRPTIRILFEHGQFNVSAGDLTYQVMVIYTMGLPAYVATEVTTRGLLSLRDARTPLLTNIGQLLLRAALVGVLLEPLGALAIPLALALSSTLEAILLTAILLARLARCTKA